MTNKSSKAFATLLSQFAKELDSLSAIELDALVQGRKRLKIELTDLPIERHRPKRRALDNEAAGAVIARLNQLSDRAEGEGLLKTEYSNRDQLASIARTIDIPVHKADTVIQLIEKIVEATIGFRIRSAAIQGDFRKRN